MILAEIERTFDPQIIKERFLGEHKWSEFLLKPSEEEKNRVTQIFYSFYASHRDAQKDGKYSFTNHIMIRTCSGWKRIHAEDKFFENWKLLKYVCRLYSII